MTSVLYHMNAANLFVGDDDPNNSLFMVINSVKIPGLTEKTKSHSAAGAMSDLELAMGSYEPIMLGFTCEGVNPDVMARMGQRIKYTMRGNLVNVRTGIDTEIKAVLEGKMVKYEPSGFEKDKGITSDYEIKEVVSYALWVGGQEKIYLDYFAGPIGVRIDGVQTKLQQARNLGLA